MCVGCHIAARTVAHIASSSNGKQSAESIAGVCSPQPANLSSCRDIRSDAVWMLCSPVDAVDMMDDFPITVERSPNGVPQGATLMQGAFNLVSAYSAVLT